MLKTLSSDIFNKDEDDESKSTMPNGSLSTTTK